MYLLFFKLGCDDVNFFFFCCCGVLIGMLLFLGIILVQVVDWLCQVIDSYGMYILLSQLLCIVFISVMFIGLLLVIDVLVVVSGVIMLNNCVVDSQGFLCQWSEVVKVCKLVWLYIGELSVEVVVVQMLDLILVSVIGGDFVLLLYDQFKIIVLMLVINYDDKSW